jgi:N-acetyl-gamma-glutamyl-phosphate reductase
MISVGIIGGSGYTGKKLIQFCNIHKEISSYKVYGSKTAGETVHSLFPDFVGITKNIAIESVDNIDLDLDVYFIALPHGEALKYVPKLVGNGKKVIDLGGDYRLDFEELYIDWYKFTHTSSYLLKSKLYGLADIVPQEKYNNVNLIANPGCYPTATLLSLLPFITNFAEDILTVSTVAYSGTSGAGKSAKSEYLLTEMAGNARAYNVNKHRHQPEILQALYKQGFHSPFSFTTHLLPAAVGIYATSSVHLKEKADINKITDAYQAVYENSKFVRLREVPPQLSWVTGTNFCDINISVEGSTLIITSAIDNLIKGAAGQAIQNMNKLYGWDEGLGLITKEVESVSVCQ